MPNYAYLLPGGKSIFPYEVDSETTPPPPLGLLLWVKDLIKNIMIIFEVHRVDIMNYSYLYVIHWNATGEKGPEQMCLFDFHPTY
jgi:hypothetical protein